MIHLRSRNTLAVPAILGALLLLPSTPAEGSWLRGAMKAASRASAKGEAKAGFRAAAKPTHRQQAFNTVRHPPNDGFVKPAPRPTTTLPKGVILDRLGPSKGRFVAPAGTPTPQRALPTALKPRPFHAYVVQKPLPGVKSGTAARNFGQPGGGPQMKLPSTTHHLTEQGFLRKMSPKEKGFQTLHFNAQATQKPPAP